MLREKVLKLFKQKCPITNFFFNECDVCHIIPQSVNNTFKDNVYNCILLSSSLHRLFDTFMWTFDVFSAVENEKGFINISLIASPSLKIKYSILGLFHKTTIQLPIQCLPFLYAHYRVFFIKNYTNHNDKFTDKELFDEYSNDSNFKNATPKYFQSQSHTCKNYVAIIDSKNNYYKIVWEYKPFEMASWININDVNQNDRDMYESMMEKKKYHDYMKGF